MEKAEFSKFLGGIAANGCVLHSVALGFELGLFKHLCSLEKPVSVEEVADALNMKPR